MLVHFGYVAMSLLVDNASPAKTMTLTGFRKLPDRDAALRRLARIAEENLANTLRLLRHNKAHDIHLYRFSSKLVPLIGHGDVADWDPLPRLAPAFAAIGAYAREHGMRTGFHPDHFTLLSTPREDVLASSIADLRRHVRYLELMGLDDTAKSNIHIGGAYGDKVAAAARFCGNFARLDDSVKRRLTLENDDKTFTAAETLAVCEQIGVPMVLDIHHHMVNHDGEDAVRLWPRIARTWSGQRVPPKIHASSPRSEREPRAHADYVDAAELLRFLRAIAPETERLDVMLEAKAKDVALLRLMEELRGEPGIVPVDGATVVIER